MDCTRYLYNPMYHYRDYLVPSIHVMFFYIAYPRCVYDESTCSRQTLIELVPTSFLVTAKLLLLESIFLSVPFSPRHDHKSSSP
ncbi:hypothetical protein M413DRAFT_221144 [Hebeloma cylindrosporum]|uniref:Uncharacterized protein n=1 Tax=Hebeloma cylindrosporum TaxID=76867 RepID=A0A0C3CWB3_HEBCY|nr:hypothetical protein M413DRAFT_221144 [Hebeloma cylindrosporum h7]